MSSRSSFKIVSYHKNAVLQLVVATGVGFILYQMSWVTMVVFGVQLTNAVATAAPYVGLKSLHDFYTHCWTLLTYGFIHNKGAGNGLFVWISNMVWLYCFGSVVQALVGYRQVIPLFFYGLLGGGVFFLLSQLIPVAAFQPREFMMTSQAGVMALAMATLTLEPKYRFYFGEEFNIPLYIVLGIYLLLNLVLNVSDHLPMIMLSCGGLLTGFIYSSFLKKGYRPGAWMYAVWDRWQNLLTPDEHQLQLEKSKHRKQVLNSISGTQQRLDEILDKINQRGYNSLSSEEKDFLLKASKD